MGKPKTLPKEAISLYAEGYNIKDIAERFSLNWYTVRKYLLLYGVTLRGTGGNQRGAKNPFWKGGTSKSTICRLTRRILNEAGIDQYTCQRCGRKKTKKEGRHNIHHIDEDRSNNTLENLEVLCVRCHNGHAKGARHWRPVNKRNPANGRFKCQQDTQIRR